MRSWEIAISAKASLTLYVWVSLQCGHGTSIFDFHAFMSERTSVPIQVQMGTGQGGDRSQQPAARQGSGSDKSGQPADQKPQQGNPNSSNK
jgi:hypothetical protein